MTTIVLVGGGHAHLSVLQTFERERGSLAGCKLVLISPSRGHYYSGMLPGWIAGHYRKSQCQIDLEKLALRAGATLVIGTVRLLDPVAKTVALDDGRMVTFDVLSLDVGSETDVRRLEQLGDRLTAVKPLSRFFDAWPDIAKAASQSASYRLAVIGGGAAAVELALACAHALNNMSDNVSIDLVTAQDGVLASFDESLRHRAVQRLAVAGVEVVVGPGVGRWDGLQVENTIIAADRYLAATGARAPAWLKSTGLQLDDDGYVLVDAYHRSISHPHIYAAGDVCARHDVVMARSGVHAVHAGPVVGANLLAECGLGQAVTYVPRRRSLYILACGPKYAIASWGTLSAQGRWAWHLKDLIDRRFIARFS